MSEISERVKAIIVDKLGVSEAEVTPEATFQGIRTPMAHRPQLHGQGRPASA